MLPAQFAGLANAAPTGLDDALGVVDGVDDALVAGLGRLGEAHEDALDALAAALATSPLAAASTRAVTALRSRSVTDEALTTLAGARAAVLGAAHDALLAGIDAALGRERATAEPAAMTEPVAEPALAGCRSWLREVALAGWRGVDDELLASSAQARQAVLAEPGHRRLAVLLDGLVAELRDASPLASAEHLPARRWADLWSRAMLLSLRGAWSAPAEPVTGRLLPLGAEVAEHGTAARLRVHGILEASTSGARPRLVRVSVTASKVDTISGPALWHLMAAYPNLLRTLTEHRAALVTDLVLRASGDLVWREDDTRLGEAADPFVTARVLLPGVLAPATAPLDRHPVAIAEPVLVEGYAATRDDDTGQVTFDLGGPPLPVDLAATAGDPAQSLGPLTATTLAASSACLGLLRWDDGGFRLRPLAATATVKKKQVIAHAGDWAQGATDPKTAKAQARAGDPVAVLRERAGRLLRA